MKPRWLAINARYTSKRFTPPTKNGSLGFRFLLADADYFFSQPFLWKYQKGTVIETAIRASENG